MLVEDVRREGGYSEERFLHCVSRLLRRSEGEEGSSAYFGRNDNVVACAERCSGQFEVRDQKFEIRCGY